MTENVFNNLESTTRELQQVLTSLDQEQINIIPFEGSWTAAQLGEHIHKSDTGMLKMLYGSTKLTERVPDQKIEEIKRDFLDFTIKTKSPAFVVPADGTYDKENLINRLLTTRTAIGEGVKTLDLSQTCLSFSFPVYGELTRLELVWFIIYHTQRHIHQLKNIAQRVTSPGQVHHPAAASISTH